MKQKIWQRALSHRKNNPKADSDAYETSADMILSELISHGEVDDQMLIKCHRPDTFGRLGLFRVH